MIASKVKQYAPATDKKVSPAIIKKLVNDLCSEDGLIRVRARKRLVALGNQAVRPLKKLLASKREWVRWEAAKALGQIGDPAAARALIKALEDNMFDVRWLAAEGLISMGNRALVPLLEAIKERPDSFWLREGVHHVLHDINNGHLTEILRPVIMALEGFEPSVEAPPAIKRALEALNKK
jgi:HEAT repeat protein